MNLILRVNVIFVFCLWGCSTAVKEDKPQTTDTSIDSKSQLQSIASGNFKWKTYTDSVNIGFVVTFKYPPDLFAEHFENAECIGKKIKMVDDGPMTSMDCCIWMDDISEGDNMSIDTLILYDLKKLKRDVAVYKDSISVANVQATRVRFFDRHDKTKIHLQTVYFKKYDTFFEVNNNHLSSNDFDLFLQSLVIQK